MFPQNRSHASIFSIALMVLFLVVGPTACGDSSGSSSSSSPDTTQDNGTASIPTPTPTPTPTPPPPVTLLPLKLDLTSEGADPGWQKLSIVLGIRNNSSTVSRIEFPGDTKVTVSIKEQHDYPFGLSLGDRPPNEPFVLNYRAGSPGIGAFYRFAIPAGFAFCGMDVTDRTYSSQEPEGTVMLLRATGKIPQGTTPSILSVQGYPPVDLTTKASASSCTPVSTSSLSKLPAQVIITPSGSSNKAVLHAQSIEADATMPKTGIIRTLLHATLENQDRFGTFALNDLQIWALDEDGVARSPYGNYYAEESCNYKFVPLKISAGPAQSVNVNVCFPHRTSHRVVALVIASPSTNIYQVVGSQ